MSVDALTEVLAATLQLLITLGFVATCWLGHRLTASRNNRATTPLGGWVGLVKPADNLGGRLALLAGLALFSLGMSGLERLLGLNVLLEELIATGPVVELARIDPMPAALIAGLAYAALRTGGAEELLFRGLIYKRLIAWFGEGPANITQSLLFTLIHNGLVQAALPDASLWLHADIFVRVFVYSWVLGWYMERRDNGSLLMPWICHSTVNFLTFLSYLLP